VRLDHLLSRECRSRPPFPPPLGGVWGMRVCGRPGRDALLVRDICARIFWICPLTLQPSRPAVFPGPPPVPRCVRGRVGRCGRAGSARRVWSLRETRRRGYLSNGRWSDGGACGTLHVQTHACLAVRRWTWCGCAVCWRLVHPASLTSLSRGVGGDVGSTGPQIVEVTDRDTDTDRQRDRDSVARHRLTGSGVVQTALSRK